MCYICNHYSYCQVHYQRGVLATNKGLTEITDEEILNELRYEHKREYVKQRALTPFICGSVVEKR